MIPKERGNWTIISMLRLFSPFRVLGFSAALAGCSAGFWPPADSTGEVTPFAAVGPPGNRDVSSWMAPSAQAEDLLYVPEVHDVAVYSYPLGKLVGRLRGFYVTGGDCVDKNQDVWIADLGHNRMVEYAHGSTKALKTLTNSGLGCAVDPTTGNLAVAQLGGTVLVWKQARGTPAQYSDALITRAQYCGYDGHGNLFVDGANGRSGYQFELAELPRGGSSLDTVDVDQFIGGPAGVQWNGQHLAIGDGYNPVIYEFAIKKNKATKVGMTELGSPDYYSNQFYIDSRDQRVIVPNEYTQSGDRFVSDVLYYKYPTGGAPTKNIQTNRGYPHAVVVSTAVR